MALPDICFELVKREREWQKAKEVAATRIDADVVQETRRQRSVIPAALVETIDEFILSQVEACVTVNTTTLAPMIQETFEANGEGFFLAEQGGPLKISTTWIRPQLDRLDSFFRKATKAAQKRPEEYKQLLKMTALRYAADLSRRQDGPHAADLAGHHRALNMCGLLPLLEDSDLGGWEFTNCYNHWSTT
ncbi:hypothetical protein WJX74_009078 [Apatococcus lobatus]|uniref:Uncharacterized protein n=1 Tax=Apatococcus lobatus TaxID=904363 RepID=A0AAW1Q950_9CHLO